MPLRDLLYKKDKITDAQAYDADPPPIPTFIRSDTNTYEVLKFPSFPAEAPIATSDGPAEVKPSRLSIFKPRTRSSSAISNPSARSSLEKSPNNPKRLSQRLHLGRARSSTHIPRDLPDIASVTIKESGNIKEDGEVAEKRASAEAQWEERATKLAQFNEVDLERNSAGPSSPSALLPAERSPLRVSTPEGDDNIQEAIRLHEAGDLERSTSMFGRLADLNGENNALSQVLYGLALRHGWGTEPNTPLALTYLKVAASNAGKIEDQALQAGMKKGGPCKGELVLAMYELGNCYRHGWGVEKDAVAAKNYYEVAANMGDTDAMNEVAWCYLEGKGTKKDKFAAAKYYRLSETAGNRTMGNSWIWKTKYDDPK